MNKHIEAANIVKETLGFDEHVKLSIFPGTDPNATAQDIADNIMAAIKEITSGNAEVLEFED